MCGRVDIHTPPAQLARALEAQLAAGIDPDGRPSWNVGPTRAIPAVVNAEGQKVLDLFRWGLVPHWAKNPKVGGYKMINARAETAGSSNAYKGALKARRCLVVVDGFYEWAVANPEEPKTSKVPFYFKRSDGQPITFAGLYEFWWDKSRAKEGGEPDPESYMQTCVIVTTEAGPDISTDSRACAKCARWRQQSPMHVVAWPPTNPWPRTACRPRPWRAGRRATRRGTPSSSCASRQQQRPSPRRVGGWWSWPAMVDTG